MHLGSVCWVERELDSFFFPVNFYHLLIQVSVEINVLPPYPTVVTGSPVFSLLVFLLTRAQAEFLLGNISESFHDVVIGWVTGFQWELWF